MIEISITSVWGFRHAIRGMRNPMNSWAKSDSDLTGADLAYCAKHQQGANLQDIYLSVPEGLQIPTNGFILGENDVGLMNRLNAGGQPHRKFLRQIMISVDINAPFYWWKEFDTYKVGTTANSCSTMHKITSKEFDATDFSCEHLSSRSLEWLDTTIDLLNYYRDMYLNYDEKEFQEHPEKFEYMDKKDIWWQLIQTLPTAYNQKRTITMNYENVLNMYEYRIGHKLDEWREFCWWAEQLPYMRTFLSAAKLTIVGNPALK